MRAIYLQWLNIDIEGEKQVNDINKFIRKYVQQEEEGGQCEEFIAEGGRVGGFKKITKGKHEKIIKYTVYRTNMYRIVQKPIFLSIKNKKYDKHTLVIMHGIYRI